MAKRGRVKTYPTGRESCPVFREYPFCLADPKAKGGVSVIRVSPALAARVLRQRGFPLYDLSLPEKRKMLAKLLGSCRPIHRGVVRQETRFNPLASCYFPHMWAVRAGKKRTTRELFDGKDLPRALSKRGKLRERTQYERDEEESLPELFEQYLTPATLDPASVRKALRIYSGTQGVSTFSPVAAATIYRELLPKEGGDVWDPSCGWGGRLLGAIASDKVHKYIGCDPSTETYKGLLKMRDELLPMARSMGRNLKVELYKLGSETKEMRDALPKGGVDVVFSSPPYFGQEEYSSEPTQSYVRFRTPDAWLNGFMRMTLDNCAYCLKSDGTLAINIANVSDYPGNLEDDFLALAESRGWKLDKKMKLALSVMPGTRGKQKRTHKYEPIFVFKKKP
jgi:DNA methylase